MVNSLIFIQNVRIPDHIKDNFENEQDSPEVDISGRAFVDKKE